VHRLSYWVDLLGSEVRYVQGRYRTRAVCAGSGEPLLLLHGTGGHLENYARNIEALSHHFHVIAIDMLWHGYTDTVDFSEDVLPPMVDHVVDVLDALGIDAAHVEGQSLGGWVAGRLAVAHPDRVQRLVLTTPMGFDTDAPIRADVDWMAIRDGNLHTLSDPSHANVRRRLERIVADPSSVTDEAVAVRQKIYQRAEVNSVQARLMSAYLGGDAVKQHLMRLEDIRQLTMPTLVYWGAANMLPESVGRWLAETLPQGQFHCAQRAGHWAQYESADEHNRVVIDFLRGATASAGELDRRS
jgi:2-hydroxy-6-oxonona-2,4-dienedioate hydrolase